MPQISSNIKSLRNKLNELGLSGFIIPKADEFQNENVPPHADRLRFVTGFTGSAGVAVVLVDRAALIVDSRYVLQARAEVDADVFTVELWPGTAAHTYLSEHVKRGEIIGYDPRLQTLAGFKSFRQEAKKHGFILQAVDENLIDSLWQNRPSARFKPIFPHDEAFAGESVPSKLARVKASLAKQGGDGLFVSAPDSVAWLFNIRGSDIAYTPLAMLRAYLPLHGQPVVFVQDGHITPDYTAIFGGHADIESIMDLPGSLTRRVEKGAKIVVDPARTSLFIANIVKQSGAALIQATDPCTSLKAQKNAVECEGARAAQSRDGVALTRFLVWLEENAGSDKLDEMGAAAKLSSLRREVNLFEGESFETISGAGVNGAIVHYRVTPETNKPLALNSLYLIDSGGQYKDGTTDVTRTVAIGRPTPEMRRHFTLVLKGHIALATARFPVDTRGCDLDAFARRALWHAGLDYGHGTGHGVGSFLSVHEGPQGIARSAMARLEPGMIVSNEPGYYREGHYGIRIENLMLVKEAEAVEGGEVLMMGFETLTLAPIDRRLIDLTLLSPEETAWLNTYHARVRAAIAPSLRDDEQAWLQAATAPLTA